MAKSVRIVILLMAGLLALAACASTSESGPSGSSASGSINSDGGQPAYRTDVDELSPLVITSLAPDPIPVTGTDGKVHVVYELQVLNASPLPASLVKLETLEGDAAGTVLFSAMAPEIAARTVLVGAPNFGVVAEVPGGRTGILLEDDAYPTRADVPNRVTHRISATFRGARTKEASLSNYYPTKATDVGGEVTTGSASPAVIGSPLAGDGWLAGNGCCTFSSHRGVMMPFGGRINGAERFAIDFQQVDLNSKPLVDLQAGRIVTYRGDPTKNESYLAWDSPVRSVADGTVVKVVSNAPDIAPGALPANVAIGEATGNRVIIDIGDGVYTLFAHLKQDSPTVRVGDKVKRGQVIGRLGNSGNTTEPHLHFQLTRSEAPLVGDNVPFEIDAFSYEGVFMDTGEFDASATGPRTRQLPLARSVTSYPR